MRQSRGFEEHVLSAAESNTFGAIFARSAGIAGVIRIRPNLQAGELICPAKQCHQFFLLGNVRCGQFELANEDLTRGAI